MPKNPSLMFPAIRAREVSDNTKVSPTIVRDPVEATDDKKKYLLAKQYLKKQPSQGTSIQNVARKFSPLPINAASVAMKKVFGTNKLDRNSLTTLQRQTMYKVLENAYKRTGNSQGGTEYEDYKNAVPDDEYNNILDIKKGAINPVLGTFLGASSPGYAMATTLGRVSYTRDPDSGNFVLTDTYDFKNSFTQDKEGKLKKDYMKGRTDSYAKIRKGLAEEDQNVDPAKFNVGMELYPSDTIQSPLSRLFLRKK